MRLSRLGQEGGHSSGCGWRSGHSDGVAPPAEEEPARSGCGRTRSGAQRRTHTRRCGRCSSERIQRTSICSRSCTRMFASLRVRRRRRRLVVEKHPHPSARRDAARPQQTARSQPHCTRLRASKRSRCRREAPSTPLTQIAEGASGAAADWPLKRNKEREKKQKKKSAGASLTHINEITHSPCRWIGIVFSNSSVHL